MITDVNRMLPLISFQPIITKQSDDNKNIIGKIKLDELKDEFVHSEGAAERPIVEIGDWVQNPETGDKYLKINIYDEPYMFKQDEYLTEKKLKQMINNIEKTYRGFFVKRNCHEELIPYMLKGVPDIVHDDLLIQHGNAKTVSNLESKVAAEKMNRFLYRDVNVDDLKTINYMLKTEKGYDNNESNVAYSVYDEKEDNMYLFIPKDGIVKKMYDNGYVKEFDIF